MGKNILNERDIRESYFYTCARCGKDVFGDFEDTKAPRLCDSCKMILEAEKKKKGES